MGVEPLRDETGRAVNEAIEKTVTDTVRTALEWPSSESMNIGETSTRGHALIQ